MKKTGVLTVLLTFLLLLSIVHAEEKAYLFELKSEKPASFVLKLEMHAKTTMAMLFMHEITTYLRFSVDQLNALSSDEVGKGLIKETTVATASVEYYLPGQPNQSLPEDVIDDLLWNSGLGSRDSKIITRSNRQGIITSVDGVPEKFRAFYENDMLFYPEHAVKIGDSWERNFVQPLPVDPNQPPFDFDVKGNYTFKRLLNDGREAEIAFRFETSADHAMQAGKKVKVDVRLLREGKMIVRIADGWPVSLKSQTEFSFIYSENNYVKSTENTSAFYEKIEEKPEAE